MSDYIQKENRGSLFKNDRKSTPTQPDYKGDINVGGILYWLSAWIEESKSATKYMSISVQEKEEKDEPKPATPQDDFDEDVPF